MVVAHLARIFNAREDGLRLFICVLAGYPLAFVHRSVLHQKPAHVQHAFFVVTGITLHFFFSGFDVVHTLVAIVLAFVITQTLAGRVESIVAAHVSFLGYILVAYWFEESDGYDINWTTPFCVLVLRMIGLVMNVYDGVHYDSLKSDQKKVAIKPDERPDLLEIAAFAFFYTGTFTGPQFTLKKFRSCVKGEWLNEKKQPRESAFNEAMNRLVGGCAYMALNQWGCSWLPNSYFNTPEFYKQTFFWRWTWATIWSRIVTSRYLAMWLVVEGAAILNGLGYNGKTSKGKDRWDGVRDVDVMKWETGHDFTSCIESFNRTTNNWAKNYIMRRLRWMGSKPLAHLTTLAYLAVWHGYHLGYFMIFGYEFGCVTAQKQLYSLIDRTPSWSQLISNSSVRPFVLILGRITVMYSLGFGFLTFGLIKRKYWIGPISSLYFVGYLIYFVLWPLLYKMILNSMPEDKRSKMEAPVTSDFVTTRSAKESQADAPLSPTRVKV